MRSKKQIEEKLKSLENELKKVKEELKIVLDYDEQLDLVRSYDCIEAKISILKWTVG